MGRCCQSTWLGRECPLPGGAVPDGPAAPGQDVRLVPPGVAAQDGLVACRLQHQCLPLLRPGRGCAAARVPDAGAPAECGVTRVGRVALQPLYASRDLRRAGVVDETLPAVCQQRRHDDVQLLRREGCRRRVRCGVLAGPRVSAGDVGEQLRWPRRHGSHGDGRDRGRQRRAVPWAVLPEPSGIAAEVPAGRRSGHRSAVRAVPFGPVRAVAPPLLYRGGRVERGALLQRLRALPWREAPAGPAAGSSARPGAPGACGTGSVGGAPGPPGVERGVGAGTSGPVRWTVCRVLATVPPRLPGARPRHGAATPGGPGSLTCPQAGCGSAGRAPAAAPAPGPAPRR